MRQQAGLVRRIAFTVTIGMLLEPRVVQGAPPTQRLNRNGVALCADRDSKDDADCFDPVGYLLDHKAEKVGAENAKVFRASYKSAVYVFTNQAHLDAFKAAPEKFAPQFGGWCAYAVAAKQEKVDIDPESFQVQDGRLLLFYDGVFAHTKKTWLSDKDKTAAVYLKEADSNWPKVELKEP